MMLLAKWGAGIVFATLATDSLAQSLDDWGAYRKLGNEIMSRSIFLQEYSTSEDGLTTIATISASHFNGVPEVWEMTILETHVFASPLISAQTKLKLEVGVIPASLRKKVDRVEASKICYARMSCSDGDCIQITRTDYPKSDIETEQYGEPEVVKSRVPYFDYPLQTGQPCAEGIIYFEKMISASASWSGK